METCTDGRRRLSQTTACILNPAFGCSINFSCTILSKAHVLWRLTGNSQAAGCQSSAIIHVSSFGEGQQLFIACIHGILPAQTSGGTAPYSIVSDPRFLNPYLPLPWLGGPATCKLAHNRGRSIVLCYCDPGFGEEISFKTPTKTKWHTTTYFLVLKCSHLRVDYGHHKTSLGPCYIDDRIR